jgi:hypothetical protein
VCISYSFRHTCPELYWVPIASALCYHQWCVCVGMGERGGTAQCCCPVNDPFLMPIYRHLKSRTPVHVVLSLVQTMPVIESLKTMFGTSKKIQRPQRAAQSTKRKKSSETFHHPQKRRNHKKFEPSRCPRPASSRPGHSSPITRSEP